MKTGSRYAAAIAAALSLSASARAHDLRCEHALKPCDGGTCDPNRELTLCGTGFCGAARALHVSAYPARFDVLYTLVNAHPTDPSSILRATPEPDNLALFAEDGLMLWWQPDQFFHGAPIGTSIAVGPLPVGGLVVSGVLNRGFDSYEACRTVAGLPPGGQEPVVLDHRMLVFFEHGEAECTARVVCEAPPAPPAVPAQ